jgi:hypothetical protein
LPGQSQRVQIDFTPLSVKQYDVTLTVDLSGVGVDLYTLPIVGKAGGHRPEGSYFLR